MGQSLGSNTQTSTNDYASVLKVQVPGQVKTVLVHLIEKNVNAVIYRIRGSIDDATYETLPNVDGVTLAKNASAFETCDDPWLYFDVQVKSAVAGVHGSLEVLVSGGG